MLGRLDSFELLKKLVNTLVSLQMLKFSIATTVLLSIMLHLEEYRCSALLLKQLQYSSFVETTETQFYLEVLHYRELRGPVVSIDCWFT